MANKNILWIDDQPIRFFYIKDLKNVNVYFAHGYNQIKHYIDYSSIDWDLIILDHDMPLMDGIQVINEFLLDKNIQIILCSNNEEARKRQFNLLNKYCIPVVQCDVWNNNFKDTVYKSLDDNNE